MKSTYKIFGEYWDGIREDNSRGHEQKNRSHNRKCRQE